MKFVIAAAALALAGTTAFAEPITPTWPKEWLGAWCLAEVHSQTAASFERGRCSDLIIRQNGYNAVNASCTLLTGRRDHNAFNALVACDGDPQQHFQLLRFSYDSGASRQLLLVDKLQRAPAIVEAGHDDE